MKFLSWGKGKRTYISIATGLALLAAQQLLGLSIPEWAINLATLFGIGFARFSVSNQGKLTTGYLGTLVTEILNKITVPEEDTSTKEPLRAPRKPIQPGDVVKAYDGTEIVIGHPSPSQNLSEERITDALNSAQVPTK